MRSFWLLICPKDKSNHGPKIIVVRNEHDMREDTTNHFTGNLGKESLHIDNTLYTEAKYYMVQNIGNYDGTSYINTNIDLHCGCSSLFGR